MTEYTAQYTIPGEINSVAVNGADITNGSKFETSYHVSENVAAVYDDENAPTLMSLSYSSSTTPATSFRGTKYNPVCVTYFNGPIHSFKVGDYGDKDDSKKGEIVIKHTEYQGGNKTLFVHIPTISTNTNIYGVSKAAEIFQQRGGMGEENPPFTANDILPRKPFLYYENGTTTSIVIIPTDNTCYIEIPDEYLTEKKFVPANISTTDTDLKYKYSSELPAYGTHLLKDEIYIDCNPAGASDDTFWAQNGSVAGDLLDGGVGSADMEAKAKTSAMYVWMVILSMIIPIVIVVMFWYLFKVITRYLKLSGSASAG